MNHSHSTPFHAGRTPRCTSGCRFPSPVLQPLLWLALLSVLFPLTTWGQQTEEIKKIRKIVILGVKKQRLISIRAKIRLTEGANFSERALYQDIKRLHETNQFTNIRTQIQPYAGGVKVEFFLTPRPQIGRTLIFGRDEVELEELAKVIRSKRGEFYNPALVSIDRGRILDLYHKKGFLFAQVKTKVAKRSDGKMVLRFLIKEGPIPQIYDLKLVGNKNFTESEILQHIQTEYKLQYRHRPFYTTWLSFIWYITLGWWTEEEFYDREKFLDDIENIKRYYRAHGFFDVTCFYKDMVVDRHRERVVISLQVIEGPRYKVGKIRFNIKGKAALDKHATTEAKEAFLRKRLTLKPKDFFDSQKLQEDVKKLTREYHRRAYILAKVNFKLHFFYKRNSVDIHLNIIEKKKIKIERISFQGNTRTKASVIRRYLTFAPGEWFNADKIEESQYKIFGTRFFEKFDLRLTDGSEENSRNIVFEVKEGRTGSFIFGGGVASDFGFFGNFQFIQRNFDITDTPKSWKDFINGNAFVGGGQLLSLTLQPGVNRSNYNILFREPFLFGYPVTFSVNGFFFNRDQDSYTEERIGGSLTLGRRIGNNLLAEVTYEFQRIEIFDIDFNAPPDVFAVKGTNNLSSFTFTLTYDRQKVDRNIIAYGGFKIVASYEYAGNVLGGDFDFSKALIRGQLNFWLLGSEQYKHVLSFRSQAGWTEEHTDSSTVPIFERFFLGGGRSVRGFEFRGIGPQINNDPIGANVMILGTAEYNFPLLGNFVRGVGFIDVGKLSPRLNTVREDDFRVSVGFGFRVRIPIFPAPVQLDFGFPLEKNDTDDTQTFHFSLGFNF